MIVDCAYYRDGRRQEKGAMRLEDAVARSNQGGFVWLGLFEPTAERVQRRLDHGDRLVVRWGRGGPRPGLGWHVFKVTHDI